MSLYSDVKGFILGKSRNVSDPGVFQRISLIAFFAWVGLGSDGLTSSCYGPEEAFRTLGKFSYLGIFVAIATALTVIIISMSYAQIIELFPTGGGGYLVASKLLSPKSGVISGSALMIDYVLTISISIVSGADALFSYLPPQINSYKFIVALAGIILLTMMNMRGVKESIIPLVPVFLVFVLSHAFILCYILIQNFGHLGTALHTSVASAGQTGQGMGLFAMIFLVLRAYSMGAGTFTGIEAVSNGISILREPRVINAKKVMAYMASSLSLIVLGIMFSYVIFGVVPQNGKTLNAVLFETATKAWNPGLGSIFVLIILISEAALLFVAAQAGFVDGPRVLSNMAKDRWMPMRFSSLSDRLVAQNGIMIFGAAALLTVILTKGSVRLLVVLYSINVFITFSMSQLGMVVHWWHVRKEEKKWKRRLLINIVGFILSAFILVTVIVFKFGEGGWVTMAITGALIFTALMIRRHYDEIGKLIKKLDVLVEATVTSRPEMFDDEKARKALTKYNKNAKTAILFVNDFNGLGLHTLMTVMRIFGKLFKNYVFVQIGIVDTGNFKGSEEVEKLKKHIQSETQMYVDFVEKNNCYAEGITAVGTEVVEETIKLLPGIREKYHDAIFFGGQVVFERETMATNMLHNYIVFELQKQLYKLGIIFVILPIRVY